jgi:hypothetical protein
METGLEFEPWAKPGDRLIVADKLAADVASNAKIASWRRIEDVDCDGLICSHPLAALDDGYGLTCRCWPATTSPTTPVPASCTPLRATAPTTT